MTLNLPVAYRAAVETANVKAPPNTPSSPRLALLSFSYFLFQANSYSLTSQS